MDIASHGLWGSITFGKKNKKSIGIFLGIYRRPLFNGTEPPDPSLIPSYVSQIYSATHSLIIFAAIFFIVWMILKKPISR